MIKEHDCAIIEGHRARRRQNQLFRDKKSKVKWPNSKHNRMPSMAVDVAPWMDGEGIPWEDNRRFYGFAQNVLDTAARLGIKIRFGGDWDMDGDYNDQEFKDLCHFELLSTEKEPKRGTDN